MINKVHLGDWTTNQLEDKSVQLIIADPPYFEVKGEFDFVWDSFNDYLKDVEKWAVECKRVLADNGSLFWYGDAKKIAYSQIIFDKYFNLLNNIVWQNTNQSKQSMVNVSGYRSFPPLTERILFYSSKSMDITGLQTIEKEYIAPRNPFALELKKARLDKGVSINQVAEYGHFYGNVNHGGAVTNWERGYNIPNIKQWEILCNNLPIKRIDYNQLRKEYEELRKEYEELRRPFNNSSHLGDVIRLPNYETNKFKHDTIKPEKLTRILLQTCSRKGDLVLVPFAGSGTECAMAAKECREFIGFDIEPKYVEMANARCSEHLKQTSLF